ncbi:MAG: DUF721 domain-containing protein [Kordiimonadaceae bacterium]|nr:DUF721 domain-containing protein [Kordiimonadaceae bacterium]
MKTAPKKRREYRRFKATKTSLLTSKLLSPAIRAKGFAQAEVVTKWPHIVGPKLAAFCVPQRLVYPRGERLGAKLVIRCESGFATLLNHKSAQVIELVNRYFGYGAVAFIEIKQGPIVQKIRKAQRVKRDLTASENQKLTTIVGKGELSPLQEAVKSLGEVVISQDEKK